MSTVELHFRRIFCNSQRKVIAWFDKSGELKRLLEKWEGY